MESFFKSLSINKDQMKSEVLIYVKHFALKRESTTNLTSII